MPAAPNIADLKAGAKPPAPSKEVGTVYLVSQSGWVNLDLTADKLYNLQNNAYIADFAQKQVHRIFSDAPTIEILDEKDNADEEVQLYVNAMFEQPEVAYRHKMIQGFLDDMMYGKGIFNPVWKKVGGELRLVALRHLPAHSFKLMPSGRKMYCQILQGITKDDSGKNIEYWQWNGIDAQPEQLPTESLFVFGDPMQSELGGHPRIAPLVPIVEMLNFVWGAEMQRVNRVGAPPLFIKVTNPQDANANNDNVGDLEYAKTLLASWGASSQFGLRSNMELIEFKFRESSATTDVINKLELIIANYSNPTSYTSDQGANLGGGDDKNAGEEMRKYVNSMRLWISEAFEQLAQKWLDANGYEGYTAKIRFPPNGREMTEVNIKQAEMGYMSETLDYNEIRERLGAKGISEEAMQKIMDGWAARKIQKQAEQGAADANRAAGGVSKNPTDAGKSGGARTPTGRQPVTTPRKDMRITNQDIDAVERFEQALSFLTVEDLERLEKANEQDAYFMMSRALNKLIQRVDNAVGQ